MKSGESYDDLTEDQSPSLISGVNKHEAKILTTALGGNSRR